MNNNFDQTTQPTPDPSTPPRLNPWLSIWFKPTATMQQMVDDTPNWLIWLLAMAGGIVNTLSRMSNDRPQSYWSLPGILPGAIIGGAISGIIGLAIVSALLRWTGSWIGGSGSYDRVKTAVAWSNVPQIIILLLNIIMLAIMKKDYFLSVEILRLQYPIGSIILYLISLFLGFVLYIWSFIMLIKSLAVAQYFSAGKAFLNIIITGLVVFVPIFLIVLLTTLL